MSRPVTKRLECLAIVPARGGSRGVPGKNARMIAGKPLIAHTVLAAREATLVNRLVVSTDDPQIADLARNYGAEVVMRPSELATDTASSESALLHVLSHLQAREGYRPDLLAFLQCTSPLILASDIDETITALLEGGAKELKKLNSRIEKLENLNELVGALHEFEDFRRLRKPFGPVPLAVDQQRLFDDLTHCHARIERRKRILEDHLHLAPKRHEFSLAQRV